MQEKATLLRLKELGINVEKTYVKRKRLVKKQGNSVDGESEIEETEITVAMYEIWDGCSDNCENMKDVNESSTKPDSTPEENKLINIFKIEKRVALSFDHILSSIHNDYYEYKYYQIS